MFRNIPYFIVEACRGLFKNGWMSLASIGVVAIALFIFGIFVLLNMNVDLWSDSLHDQIAVVLFIDDDATESMRNELSNYLDNHKAISDITFVSKDEAFKNMEKKFGSDFLEGLENPLPDSYEISVWVPETVFGLVEELETMPTVYNVRCDLEIVEKITRFTKALRNAAMTLMILLAITATFLISHNIRMTVLLRSKEIMIMKYVGATDSFIRLPFLLEGLFLGFLGTLIPLTYIYFGYSSLLGTIETELAFLPMLPFSAAMEELFRLTIPFGLGLGVIGSLVSIGRYLKV